MLADFLSFIVGKIVFLCASIAGDSFPKPLSKEEEDEMVLRLPYDEDAKATLIERNLRLVVYIARKFENRR